MKAEVQEQKVVIGITNTIISILICSTSFAKFKKQITFTGAENSEFKKLLLLK